MPCIFVIDAVKLQGIIILMKPRTLTGVMKKAMRTFPAVVVTGPRQSGKTTLLREEFGATHDYQSLENPDVRIRAREDPKQFLSQISGPVILDEIQYVPDLIPFIKSAIDEDRQPGRWLLTGSQNFTLMRGVSQSLAGRAAILSLLPFSVAERYDQGGKEATVTEWLNGVNKLKGETKRGKLDGKKIAEVILRGNYPEIVSNQEVDRQLWCGSYITTYLERDIRNLEQVGDLGQYELFLRACATRTGQILDLTAIAREIGVAFTTAKRWLSLLETGYQVLLVYPYYKNIGKRLVKRPKIYFTDTGLASYLMGVNTEEVLMSGPYLGPLFETLVVTDFWKRYLHHGQTPNVYYLRTRDKLEIDLVIEEAGKLNLIEIKSAGTIRPEHARTLVRVKKDLGKLVSKTLIISNAQESFQLADGVMNLPWGEWLVK
jgi:predicted AAA+ superfamily ATPase